MCGWGMAIISRGMVNSVRRGAVRIDAVWCDAVCRSAPGHPACAHTVLRGYGSSLGSCAARFTERVLRAVLACGVVRLRTTSSYRFCMCLTVWIEDLQYSVLLYSL